MRDDVIEFAERGIHRHDVAAAQIEVFEFQSCELGLAQGNRASREIDADELALGEPERHWHQIRSITTT